MERVRNCAAEFLSEASRGILLLGGYVHFRARVFWKQNCLRKIGYRGSCSGWPLWYSRNAGRTQNHHRGSETVNSNYRDFVEIANWFILSLSAYSNHIYHAPVIFLEDLQFYYCLCHFQMGSSVDRWPSRQHKNCIPVFLQYGEWTGCWSRKKARAGYDSPIKSYRMCFGRYVICVLEEMWFYRGIILMGCY